MEYIKNIKRMSNILSQKYQSSIMQSITHNDKYVYDPTYFYGNNKRGRK